MPARRQYPKNKHNWLDIVQIIERYLQTVYVGRRWLFLLGASLIIVVWQWPLIVSNNALLSGDFDYFTQAYEAVRKSVLLYHQFPWLNAWIGGGVPLYANPQVGVFSMQSLLVFVFGAPFGLKLSIIGYSLIGFWGMFFLLKHNIKTSLSLALALSCVWVTNGFFVAHLVSHFSFSLFLVFPLLLYLLINITKKHYWLYLGVSLGLFILAAFHYAAFHGFLLLGCAAIFLLLKNRRDAKTHLILYARAAVVFLLLAGHRIFYTLQFAFDFPRMFQDDPNSLLVTLKSFVIPYNDTKWGYGLIKPGDFTYTWDEHTVFIGYFMSLVVITLFVGSIIMIARAVTHSKRASHVAAEYVRKFRLPIGLAGLLVLFLLIAMGDFAQFSPYALLGNLPAFSGMRVPSRWLIWAVFSGLLLVGASPAYIKSLKVKQVLTLFVLVGAVEVYLVGMGNDRFYYRPVVFRDPKATFEQVEDFDHYNPLKNIETHRTRSSYDRRFEIYSYEATLNNFGQARGYEPIVDTYYAPTIRCGIVQGCPFVKSGNATVRYWSPNKVVLQRTADGPVELNINPSNYWLINGQRLYGAQRTAEVLQNFVISDESAMITLEASPRSPLELVVTRLRAILD